MVGEKSFFRVGIVFGILLISFFVLGFSSENYGNEYEEVSDGFIDSVSSNYGSSGVLTSVVGNLSSSGYSTIVGNFVNLLDFVAPKIWFVAPTPLDGNVTSLDFVCVNVSTNESGEHSAWVDWNRSLVGYWNFERYNSTGVFDNSSWGNFGSFVGGLSTGDVVAGKRGNGMEFDGANQYVSISPTDKLILKDGGTISAWVNIAQLSGTYGNTIFMKGDGVGWADLHIELFEITGADRIALSISNGTSYLGAAGPRSDVLLEDTWYHIVATWNSTSKCVFTNGIQSQCVSSTIMPEDTIASTVVNLGVTYANSYDFNGAIDEVMVWDRVLSREEINASYQAGSYRLERNFTNLEIGNYTFQAYAIDEAGNLNWTLEREVSVSNSLPTVTLISPPDWNITYNRTPELSWTGYDANGDDLTYEIRVDEEGVGTCDQGISDDTLTSESYVTETLRCLKDYGFYYNWSVRASDDDGVTWGDWSEVWHFNVTAQVWIELASDEMDFGSMIPGDIEDTTDDSPNPFVLNNIGNVVTNVSLNSSAIWDNAQTSSSYYQFKVDNYSGEEGAFSWAESTTAWYNVPMTGFVIGTSKLDYHAGNNSAEYDIRLEAPNGEPSGVKSSIINFTGVLAE